MKEIVASKRQHAAVVSWLLGAGIHNASLRRRLSQRPAPPAMPKGLMLF